MPRLWGKFEPEKRIGKSVRVTLITHRLCVPVPREDTIVPPQTLASASARCYSGEMSGESLLGHTYVNTRTGGGGGQKMPTPPVFRR